jgi:hypothetical protein
VRIKASKHLCRVGMTSMFFTSAFRLIRYSCLDAKHINVSVLLLAGGGNWERKLPTKKGVSHEDRIAFKLRGRTIKTSEAINAVWGEKC